MLRRSGALLACAFLVISFAACDSSSDSDAGGTGETGDTGGDGDGDGDLSSPGCESGSYVAGDEIVDLTVDGVDRTAILHIPPGYDPAEPMPLVVNLHGFGSNAPQQRFFSAMDAFADEQGFMVVYPEGLMNADDGRQSWNGGPTCCADDLERDDVAFARALVEAIGNESCVDQRRVFATGMSNGGYMSYRLACEAGDLFAAVAPVSGALGLDPADCEPSRAVPVWQVNGTADPLVGFGFAQTGFDNWLGQAGCETTGETAEPEGTVSCITHACGGSSEATLCTADGMGHCWPGQEFCIDPPSTLDISANEKMWEFFSRHPMP